MMLKNERQIKLCDLFFFFPVIMIYSKRFLLNESIDEFRRSTSEHFQLDIDVVQKRIKLHGF